MRGKSPPKIEEVHTHLEQKLEKTANEIGNFARFVTILSALSHFIFLIIYLCVEDQKIFSDQTVLQVTQIGIIAIVILIVAIPEGLPLAVSLAMALSTDKLKKDEILIKNVDSIQKCAMVHDVCVGKTGCLTKGRMQVAKYQLTDSMVVIDHVREEGYFD